MIRWISVAETNSVLDVDWNKITFVSIWIHTFQRNNYVII